MHTQIKFPSERERCYKIHTIARNRLIQIFMIVNFSCYKFLKNTYPNKYEPLSYRVGSFFMHNVTSIISSSAQPCNEAVRFGMGDGFPIDGHVLLTWWNKMSFLVVWLLKIEREREQCK